MDAKRNIPVPAGTLPSVLSLAAFTPDYAFRRRPVMQSFFAALRILVLAHLAAAAHAANWVVDSNPGSQAFHALRYDPVNNVFIFVTDYDSGQHTWAYRLR